MDILKDHFRSAAQLFMKFVYDYHLLSRNALYVLSETKYKDKNKPYEDYRKILTILNLLATNVPTSEIYIDDDKKRTFRTNDPRAIFKNDGTTDDAWLYLQTFKPYTQEPVHNTSIEEQMLKLLNQKPAFPTETPEFLKNIDTKLLVNLISAANQDAHNLYIQEKNKYEIVTKFINNLIKFIKGFPADKQFETDAKDNAINALEDLRQKI